MFQVLAVTMETMAEDRVQTVQVLPVVAQVHRLVAGAQAQEATRRPTAEAEAGLIILAKAALHSATRVDVPVTDVGPVTTTNP